MRTFNSILEEIKSKLSEEQIQLLKDTIRFGAWGDCEMEFKENGEWVTDWCTGYITNDAKKAGHFEGRKVSAMFRSIYSKLEMLGKGSGANEYFAYYNNWWGDGSGDVLFIRSFGEERVDAKFEKWAKE